MKNSMNLSFPELPESTEQYLNNIIKTFWEELKEHTLENFIEFIKYELSEFPRKIPKEIIEEIIDIVEEDIW